MVAKAAVIQMCSSHVLADNLANAASLIKQAAQEKAQLVVLPEMFAIMGLQASDKIVCKEAFIQDRPGVIQSFLAEQAKKNQVWLVGGTIPIATNNPNKIRAACLVFDQRGELRARYDKMHLFDVHLSVAESYQESATTEPGEDITVVDTPIGKLGLAVCYDIRFPELFRTMLNQGVQVIALPAAFTVPTGAAHWEILARSRAIENFCYVLGACQGGNHTNNRQTYGHSLIIDPWGTIIAQSKNDKPGILTANIDLNYLTQVRNKIPALQHRVLIS